MIALTYVAVIMSMATLTLLHRRRAAEAAQAEQQGEAAPGAKLPQVARSGWLVLARLGGHLSVPAALLATLLGYLELRDVRRLCRWCGSPWWYWRFCYSTRFADDLSLWLLTPDGALGRTLRLSTGVPASRLEQAGVLLLSALLRVCLVLLGIAAVMAQFGNPRRASGLGWHCWGRV